MLTFSQQDKFVMESLAFSYNIKGMEIGERIKKAREKLGFNQSELARRLNIKPQAVQAWEAGKNGPSRKSIQLLSRVLGVSANWLEFGNSDQIEYEKNPVHIEFAKEDISPWIVSKEPSTSNHLKKAKIKSISVSERHTEHLTKKIEERGFPLISWVQAGRWSEIVEDFQPGDAEMWVTFGISRRVIPNGFCLRVQGDSMEPEFVEGDIILVDPDKQLENGKFVIAKFLDTNEATFKKYVNDAGTISLHPLNYPKYQPIHLNGRKAHIVGVVIGKQKMY